MHLLPSTAHIQYRDIHVGKHHIHTIKINKCKGGVAKVVQKLRVLTTLVKNQVVSCTHIKQLTITCSSSSRASDTLFWSLQAPCTHACGAPACEQNTAI